MGMKILRQAALSIEQTNQFTLADAVRLRLVLRFRPAGIAGPDPAISLVGVFAAVRARKLELALEQGPVFSLDAFHLLRRYHALRDEVLAVDFVDRRMRADRVVEPRLGEGGLVPLVVTMPAIADQVDDGVALERGAIVERNRGGARHGLGIVAVHVQNRDLQRFGDVGRVAG